MKDESNELKWALIACFLRVLLEEILLDIEKGKIKIQCSSILTPIVLDNRLKQIDNLLKELIPLAVPPEDKERVKQMLEKKEKRLN